MSGDPIDAKHRGLLPFRVWQIFNDMVRFVKAGKVAEFVCAAGVLTHYIGDACQPLHISFLHDGDPEQPQTRTIHHRDGTDEDVVEPLGAGVHSAYEDAMVSAHRDDILDGLAATTEGEGGRADRDGVRGREGDDHDDADGVRADSAAEHRPVLYSTATPSRSNWPRTCGQSSGRGLSKCMQDGAHLLAVLWQSAWVAGDGDHTIPASALKALTQKKAMKICQDEKLLAVHAGRHNRGYPQAIPLIQKLIEISQ